MKINKFKIIKSKHDTKWNTNKFELYMKNLPIKKQLRYNTVFILILVCITALIGLTNQINMNAKLLSFYQDSYTIHTKSLSTMNSLLTIENYMYRAIASDKRNLQIKYISMSEETYSKLEETITFLCHSSKSLKSLSNSDQQDLIIEVEKLNRYRQKIIQSNQSGDMTAVFSTYKNDYVPILTTISTTLDIITHKADHYANNYIRLSKQQTLLSAISYTLLSILAALFATILSKKTTKRIVTPIQEIEDCMNTMSQGNLNYAITYTSKNELGNVCLATRIMQQKLQDYIKNIIYILEELENRNLTIEPTEEYIGDFSPIKKSLQSIIEFYNKNIHQIQDSSNKVTQLSKQVENDSLTIQDGAKTQTNTIQVLTQTIQSVTEYEHNNTELFTQLQVIFTTMRNRMYEAKQHMDNLVKQVEYITEQSNQITQIIKILENISNKTQLVSLNASIEAAHADSTGNTFVVVANEMSQLSKQCILNTDKIKPIINTTLTSIEQCFSSAAITKQSLEYTVNTSEKLNTLVNDILSASTIQHDLVDQIMNTLPQVQEIAAKNEISSEECLNSIMKNLNEINKLTMLVNSFQI